MFGRINGDTLQRTRKVRPDHQTCITIPRYVERKAEPSMWRPYSWLSLLELLGLLRFSSPCVKNPFSHCLSTQDQYPWSLGIVFWSLRHRTVASAHKVLESWYKHPTGTEVYSAVSCFRLLEVGRGLAKFPRASNPFCV